jgi:DNA-binding SARP family transcriptional activator
MPSHLRIYLTGRICAEWGDRITDEIEFPSRQARLLFAFLVCERRRPIPREELAELLWPEKIPAAWDSSLKALVSKLRHFVEAIAPEMTPGPSISSQFGCYQLHLPKDSWVDLEAARNALDEAEGAIRNGAYQRGWGPINVVLAICKRGFLPGELTGWVEKIRTEIQELLVRALEGYAEICLKTGQAELATQMASQAISLEPFRETGYQKLMLAQAALGNRGEALRSYHRCRVLLSDELGVDPSPDTEAVYLEILKQR